MCVFVPSKAKLLQNRPLACVSFASTISFLGPMAHNHGEMPLQNSFKTQIELDSSRSIGNGTAMLLSETSHFL